MRALPSLRLCLSPVLLLLAVAASPASARSIDDVTLDVPSLERDAVAALQRSVAALGATGPVAVELADLRAVPDSAIAYAVDGVGRIRVGDGGWIPLRFEAGYDAGSGALDGLRVHPLGEAARTALPVEDAPLRDRVNQQVAAQLLAEFPEQRLDIVFVDLQPTFEARDHATYRGTGVVDFAGEGRAPMAFSAILDRSSGLVVALDYELEIAGAHGEADPRGGVLASR